MNRMDCMEINRLFEFICKSLKTTSSLCDIKSICYVLSLKYVIISMNTLVKILLEEFML
jgi:hypothetical protein